ncbi:MAG: hypothetical protein KC468_03920 [Myxococcales bacterium]|nr:hypothetical protein [Myxococcales bacterium]
MRRRAASEAGGVGERAATGVMAVALALGSGCGGDDGGTETTAGSNVTTTPTGTSSSTDGTDAQTTGEATGSATAAVTTGGPDPTTGGASSDTSGGETSETGVDPGCGDCFEPNQQCVDDVCVTSCQGQDPDPCGPDLACDALTGECVDPESSCVLTGPAAPCDDALCGPGTVCDGEGGCVAIAPCNGVTCTTEGACWGHACGCTRTPGCSDPELALMNGEFANDISSLSFDDDCNAWMVTIRAGPDFVRRLTPAGALDTWTGVSEKDLGEVKALKQLTVPRGYPEGHPLTSAPPDPVPVMGYGEVAVTYICCANCGCGITPQGVAKVDDEDPMAPLPIIIPAEITSGVGPFANQWTDSGPQGLTWGNDRVLYVGNSTDNGDINTADLDAMTEGYIGALPGRVTAGAPISDVHLLFAIEGGDLYRFNVNTQDSEFVVGLGDHVTSLSHDAFSGRVYAGLANLEVIEVEPFTGTASAFATMPSRGRVAVSPSGALWFTPVKWVENGALTSWPLPTEL